MLIEIEKKGQTYSFEAAPEEKLLFAGLRAGIPLPYECSTGTCGSCRARLKEGSLNFGWTEAPGHKNLKADKNEFLMCQATAETPCKLGVPSKIQAFRDDDLTPLHQHAKICNLSMLSSDIMRFEVNLDSPVSFHAGQFFVLKAPGIDGYRAYSMVNYEPGTQSLEFIIKQKPYGSFSDWISSSDRTNDEIEIFGPLGQATFHPDENHDLVMIAGGSGIAGLMSILEHGCSVNYFESHKANLYFGIRTWDDIIFTDRLNSMIDRFPSNLSIQLVASQDSSDSRPPDSIGKLSHGYGWVHEAALNAMTPGQQNTMVYIAGPQPLVDATIRPLITEIQIPSQMIRYDKFS
jgi:toluene monooxygenase electron transfer component